jgi:hypothetical protein
LGNRTVTIQVISLENPKSITNCAFVILRAPKQFAGLFQGQFNLKLIPTNYLIACKIASLKKRKTTSRFFNMETKSIKRVEKKIIELTFQPFHSF